MNKKVAIIGYGYLGKAFARFFQDLYEVRVYDVIPQYEIEKGVKAIKSTEEEINECDLAVICVPTPMKEDGETDLTAINNIFTWLTVPLKIIKSAVIPGTTEGLNKKHGNSICVSPEYMGESKYFTPFWKYPHPTDGRYHDFLVIGGPEPTSTKVTEFFLRVMGPACRVYKMSSTEAEVVKYMENSWGSTKVTFCNEFYEICKVFGADYLKVREGFLADSRVERNHTMVLEGSRGFGGKCFVKDVNAMYHASTLAGYEPKLLKEVIESNKKFNKLND